MARKLLGPRDPPVPLHGDVAVHVQAVAPLGEHLVSQGRVYHTSAWPSGLKSLATERVRCWVRSLCVRV